MIVENLTKFQITHDIVIPIPASGKVNFYADRNNPFADARNVRQGTFQFSMEEKVVIIKIDQNGEVIPFSGMLYLYDKQGDTRAELSFALRDRTPHNGGNILAKICVANGKINSYFPLDDDLCYIKNYAPGVSIVNFASGYDHPYVTDHYIDGKLVDNSEVLELGACLKLVTQQIELRKTTKLLEGLRARTAANHISGLCQGLDRLVKDCVQPQNIAHFDTAVLKGQPISKQSFAMLECEI